MLGSGRAHLVVFPSGLSGELVFPQLQKKLRVVSKEHALQVLFDIMTSYICEVSPEEVRHITKQIECSSLFSLEDVVLSNKTNPSAALRIPLPSTN